jgi:DNA-binding NtrC family response regulator
VTALQDDVPRGSALSQTVLLVEDETLLRKITGDTLRDAGYRVLEAIDGAEALEVLRQTDDIGLLITDIKMPRLDGYQLTRAALETHPNLQVVLVSGYDPVPQQIRDAKVRIIPKPFDFDLLLILVRTILGPAAN